MLVCTLRSHPGKSPPKLLYLLLFSALWRQLTITGRCVALFKLHISLQLKRRQHRHHFHFIRLVLRTCLLLCSAECGSSRLKHAPGLVRSEETHRWGLCWLEIVKGSFCFGLEVGERIRFKILARQHHLLVTRTPLFFRRYLDWWRFCFLLENV